MGRKLVCLWALVLLAGLSQACRAQYVGLDPALAAAAKAYDEAQISGDRKALETLVADDYMLFRGNGDLANKQVLIEGIAGEGVKNNRFVVEKPFQHNLGDTVILGGWAHLTGTDHGKPFTQNLRFADTWSKRHGRWQVVFTTVARCEHP